MENLWIFWIVVGVVFLIIELVTTALVSIWFVPAAIITCILSLFVDNLPLQVASFVGLSAIFMVICRKIYNKHIKKKVDDVDQNENLIGKTVKVTEDTNGISGRILSGDIYWKAVSENGETITKGETAVVRSVNGTTLVIKKL
jgi:membrane protein implicated in regulation of membrane protease activity